MISKRSRTEIIPIYYIYMANFPIENTHKQSRHRNSEHGTHRLFKIGFSCII